MACDICGKTGQTLSSLMSIYQTDEIKDICSGCESAVNKQLRSIKKMTLRMHIELLKRFMVELKPKRRGSTKGEPT